MIRQSFKGTITGGTFIPLAKSAFKNFIKALEGRNVTVTYTDYQLERTNSQNRLYWLYIDILSGELGYSKDEMHEIVKHKFLSEEDVRTGLVHIGSTQALNTAQFNGFLTKLQLWASNDLDIYLPDPEP